VKVDIWLAKIIAHQRCVTEQFKQVTRVGFYPPTMTRTVLEGKCTSEPMCVEVSDNEHFLYQYDDNLPMPIYTGGN